MSGVSAFPLAWPEGCTDLFRGHPDSDRVDEHMWAWPLTEIEPWRPPVPQLGAQGFWRWPQRIAA